MYTSLASHYSLINNIICLDQKTCEIYHSMKLSLAVFILKAVPHPDPVIDFSQDFYK